MAATVTRPRLPTVVIGEVPPPPPPPTPPRRVPPPPPPPAPLSRGEAISLGQRWCRANGWQCRLDEAEFLQRRGVWELEFDARRPARGRGVQRGRAREIELQIDAFSGRVLRVDVA